MARISNTSAYPNLVTPVASDYLILTDEDANLMTKSCTLGAVQSLFGVDTLVAHVEVSSGRLLTLPAQSIDLIAAPGANKVLSIMNISLYMDVGSQQYDFNQISPIGTTTGTQISAVPFNTVGNGFNAAADTVTNLPVQTTATMGVNEPLVLSNNGAVTQGTGVAYFNILYRVLTVGTTF
tara:strand:+ start:3153 stop:3692 length:540 start_codon:yes stop_codon:yes gene_type:complete